MTSDPDPDSNSPGRGPFVRFVVTAMVIWILWAAPITLLTPPDAYNVIYLAPGVLLGLLLGYHIAYRDGSSSDQ